MELLGEVSQIIQQEKHHGTGSTLNTQDPKKVAHHGKRGQNSN